MQKLLGHSNLGQSFNDHNVFMQRCSQKSKKQRMWSKKRNKIQQNAADKAKNARNWFEKGEMALPDTNIEMLYVI